MHTPTKQQWQTVIDNFEKVLPLATREHHLHMMETRVNRGNHACGTIHCIGGWYAVASLDMENKSLDFIDGADEMARNLGFSDCYALNRWAADTPGIWGNPYGGYLFSTTRAYNYASTLAEAVEFLKGVRDRSPE